MSNHIVLGVEKQPEKPFCVKKGPCWLCANLPIDKNWHYANSMGDTKITDYKTFDEAKAVADKVGGVVIEFKA